jgi:hypothetical protein
MPSTWASRQLIWLGHEVFLSDSAMRGGYQKLRAKG